MAVRNTYVCVASFSFSCCCWCCGVSMGTRACVPATLRAVLFAWAFVESLQTCFNGRTAELCLPAPSGACMTSYMYCLFARDCRGKAAQSQWRWSFLLALFVHPAHHYPAHAWFFPCTCLYLSLRSVSLIMMAMSACGGRTRGQADANRKMRSVAEGEGGAFSLVFYLSSPPLHSGF